MNLTPASFRLSRLSRLYFIGVLFWNMAGLSPDIQAADAPTPPTVVEEQTGEKSDAGKVEERGLSRVQQVNRGHSGEGW